MVDTDPLIAPPGMQITAEALNDLDFSGVWQIDYHFVDLMMGLLSVFPEKRSLSFLVVILRVMIGLGVSGVELCMPRPLHNCSSVDRPNEGW